jgi:hypothetical protein
MKCVKCQNDAKKKERENGRCPKCNQRFAFDPQNGDPMTDGVFAAAIDRVSSGDRVRFQADHVYYDVRRRYRKTLTGTLVRGVVLAAFFSLFAIFAALSGQSTSSAFMLIVIWTWFVVWLVTAPTLRERRRLPRDNFDALLRRYLDAHGRPKTLIEPKQWHAPAKLSPIAGAEEMLAYSFDRAVICDRADTVDLLIANQFHFENNCAVLGIEGYPPHAFETVRAMLKNNPRLVVLALHDATVEGCTLAYRLRNDRAWFRDGPKVIDLGLRPRHRKQFAHQEDKLEQRREVPGALGISADEARWLAHSTLALAVVTPEQVIKRVFQAITVAEDDKSDGAGGAGSGGEGGCSSADIGDDADMSDGGGDSFG